MGECCWYSKVYLTQSAMSTTVAMSVDVDVRLVDLVDLVVDRAGLVGRAGLEGLEYLVDHGHLVSLGIPYLDNDLHLVDLLYLLDLLGPLDLEYRGDLYKPASCHSKDLACHGVDLSLDIPGRVLFHDHDRSPCLVHFSSL